LNSWYSCHVGQGTFRIQRRFDPLAFRGRNLIAETVQRGDHVHVETASAGQFAQPIFLDPSQIGDVPLFRLAFDADALDQDRGPLCRRALPGVQCRRVLPGVRFLPPPRGRSTLPADEHLL
jgi:hypothetical protein